MFLMEAIVGMCAVWSMTRVRPNQSSRVPKTCLTHVVIVQEVVSGVLLRKLDDGVKLAAVMLHPVVRGRDNGVGA